MVSNWKPVCSLVGDAISEAEVDPFWLWLAPTRLLHLAGDGPVWCLLALLWYSLSPLFCEQDWQCLRLELPVGKLSLPLSLFSLSLWLSHSLGCYLMLALSDCPQGIQAQSLP